MHTIRIFTLLQSRLLKRGSIAVIAALVIGGASIAQASIENFGVFGHKQVTAGNNPTISGGGHLGSNGAVVIGNNGEVLLVTGGGAFNSGTNAGVVGDILFAGNVTLGNGTTVEGDIDAGGNVAFGTNNNVTGSVRSGGNVSLGNNSDVSGSVDAAGNITGNATTSIAGTATAGGSISAALGAGAKVPNGTPTAPTAYSQITVPGSSANQANFGGANQGTGANNFSVGLLPDSYGDVVFGNNGSLTFLAPGEYYFDSLTAGSGLDIILDFALGATPADFLKIFVLGAVDLGSNVDWFDTSGALDPLSLTDAGKGASVLLEASSFEANDNGDWFGTILTPDGDISVGGNFHIAGAMYAGDSDNDGSGGTIRIGNNFEMSFAPQQTPPDPGILPEPTMLLVWSLLISCGLAVRRPRTTA